GEPSGDAQVELVVQQVAGQQRARGGGPQLLSQRLDLLGGINCAAAIEDVGALRGVELGSDLLQLGGVQLRRRRGAAQGGEIGKLLFERTQRCQVLGNAQDHRQLLAQRMGRRLKGGRTRGVAVDDVAGRPHRGIDRGL
ncbi:hypothetical protein BZG21_39820, partial [Escherichia coli]|nr:hypothetical protein [Escherichia coli]